VSGAVLQRGEPGYEPARRAAVWNERKPNRHPHMIVLAESESDVVAAVRQAREHGLRVKPRSGGHSWTASSVRDDGVLIDLSRMQEATFDAETGLASVQPGANGRALNRMLAEHDLFFPSGHCPTVGVGGFLLQGGWGWNSRAIGPACMSVEAIDVVTGAGELIRADANQNRDWLWAARGAGAGFFGVVTRFHLRCHPRPRAIFTRNDVYALADAETVLRWAMEIEPSVPAELEPVIMITAPRGPAGEVIAGEPVLLLFYAALMADDESAREALAVMDTCPVLGRALERGTPQRKDFSELYDDPDAVEPEGFRWSADGMWTEAGPDELLPALQPLLDSIPAAPSHVFWYPWRPQALPDAAISVQAPLYVAAFAGWTDPADDAAGVAWPREHMERMAGLSVGIQLADENLVDRPARFLGAEQEARLRELRARLDPDGRFHGYLSADAGSP
jgi:FAD/FMN-containing dehydrogenase